MTFLNLFQQKQFDYVSPLLANITVNDCNNFYIVDLFRKSNISEFSSEKVKMVKITDAKLDRIKSRRSRLESCHSCSVGFHVSNVAPAVLPHCEVHVKTPPGAEPTANRYLWVQPGRASKHPVYCRCPGRAAAAPPWGGAAVITGYYTVITKH